MKNKKRKENKFQYKIHTEWMTKNENGFDWNKTKTHMNGGYGIWEDAKKFKNKTKLLCEIDEETVRIICTYKISRMNTIKYNCRR